MLTERPSSEAGRGRSVKRISVHMNSGRTGSGTVAANDHSSAGAIGGVGAALTNQARLLAWVRRRCARSMGWSLGPSLRSLFDHRAVWAPTALS